MYGVFNSTYPQNIVIGELNLRGYTESTALSSLGDVGNVSSTAPSEGQALVYDTSSSQWQPGTEITTSTISNGTSAIDATYFHCSQSPLDTTIDSSSLPPIYDTAYDTAMYSMRLQGATSHTRAYYLGTVNDSGKATNQNALHFRQWREWE